MRLKRITALLVSAAMILSSVPSISFADDIELTDRDTITQNSVNKYAPNGALVGIDMEIDGVNDGGSDNYLYNESRNPYEPTNGPFKVIIENGSNAIVDVSYNGKNIEKISDQKQLLLYVNSDDRVVVKTTDKPYGENYDGWFVKYGNKDEYYNESSLAIDLSQYKMGHYDKVTLQPWSGYTSHDGYDDDDNLVTYRLTDDYNGAFGIDTYTGVVYVKDNTLLQSSSMASTPIGTNFRYIGDTSHAQGLIKLTQEKQSERSGAFSKEKIDLNYDFDISYEGFYGKEKNRSGADGMVFVLTANYPSYVGWTGGSLGYYGTDYFSNSVGIEFDTHKNDEWYGKDPYFGKNYENHIAFNSGGSVNHDTALSFKLDDGATSKAHSVLLEDNKWHDVRITWSASDKELTVYFDNKKVGTLEQDIVNKYLADNSEVYFGFTASTGSYSNKQRVDNFSMSVTRTPSITVEANYGGNKTSETIPIEITNTHEQLDSKTSTASLTEDQVKVLYASDHKGRIYKIDPEVKITEKIADTDIAWFDIANDKFTTLYGVIGNGDLYSDIDDSVIFEKDLSKHNLNINSLAVDESGNFYYVRDAVLNFYNEETGNITNIMNTQYQSLGDLVFHGGKLYYAAYRGNSYGSDPIMVELDIESKTVRVVSSIPSTTYGMASVNGDLLVIFNKQIDKIDPLTGARTEIMQIGAGASSIYGSAQGEVMISNNVLFNDLGDSTKYVSEINGQTINPDNGDYTKVYGDYGVLLIKPDGSYIYILNGKLDVLLDLDEGETLTETFEYQSKYLDNTQSDRSSLVITINGSDDDLDYNKEKGLHLDAFDLDGNNEVDLSVTDGDSIPVWHDGAGYDNSAVAQDGAPTLVADGINGKRAVKFTDYDGGMNIASHEDINASEFLKKSMAVVFETGNNISDVQYIFEEGGNVRGYNFVIAPDDQNVPSLYAMVYNKVEWKTNKHRSIRLTSVEPNTVYAAYMVHDAVSGTYKAYVNGDFIELETSRVLSDVDKQYSHPNPAGVGWINDDTIYPHNFVVVNGNSDGQFDGLIGEVITWNTALTFQDIQEVNGQLKRKWKQPEAVVDISTKQIDEELQITWAPAEGVDEYEVYLSADNTIDASDVKLTATSNLKTVDLPSQFKTLDTLNVIVRYVKDGGFSKDAVAEHRVLGKPENFVYTDLGEEYLFRFSFEEGKAYVLKHSGDVEVVLEAKGYAHISSSVDLASVELYEVAIEGSTPSMHAGHGLKADDPKVQVLGKVENLAGSLNGSNINLTWDSYDGAVEYIIYAGNEAASTTEFARSSTNTFNYSADVDKLADQVGFKYFKVKAVTNNEYKFSDDSETISVKTPYLVKIKAELENLINESWALHNGAKEGLGNDELIENDLYDIDEYEQGSKFIFQKIIESVETVLTTSDDDLKITAELKTLNNAMDRFISRKVISDNAIVLTFKDESGKVLPYEDKKGEIHLEPITYYGPMPDGEDNYDYKLDIAIDGYTRLEGELITLVFGSTAQTLDLVYSADLPKMIEIVNAVLAKDYSLGPNSDGFYLPNQYDKEKYEALKKYLKVANDANNNSNTSNSDKERIATELQNRLDDFELTLVSDNDSVRNKVTLKFIDESGNPVTISEGSELMKFAPSGFTISYTPVSNNYYTPKQSPVDVVFGDQEKNQNVIYIITELNRLVKEAEGKYSGSTEGSASDGYQPDEFESGSKSDLQTAIDAANAVLDNTGSTAAQITAAETAIQNAMDKFDSKQITKNNRIEIQMVSGETGEMLKTVTVYGLPGYEVAVNLDVISNYKPYMTPENDVSNEDSSYFKTLDITFTSTVQTFNVMYRENDAEPLTPSAKTNWRTTAEQNIIQYAKDDSIPWKTSSRYDVADLEDSTSLSTGKEHQDFLNILGNALKSGDKHLADEDFVDDYVKDIEDGETPITDYNELIEMLKKYYAEISDSFYGINPGAGQSNEKLESAKTIYYEDPINTSVVFKIKDTNVTDPEFVFSLVGNEYLSYDYPTIQLFKLEEGDDPAVDPDVLNGGKIQPSNTSVKTIINPEAGEYGYQITVKPESLTFAKGEIYYARVLTNVAVNVESPIYESAIGEVTRNDDKQKKVLAAVVEMYNNNTDNYFITDASQVKVQTIESGDLQYALGVIHDKDNDNKALTDGLMITSQAKWMLSGESQQGKERVDGLNFNLKSRPALPGSF